MRYQLKRSSSVPDQRTPMFVQPAVKKARTFTSSRDRGNIFRPERTNFFDDEKEDMLTLRRGNALGNRERTIHKVLDYNGDEAVSLHDPPVTRDYISVMEMCLRECKEEL